MTAGFYNKILIYYGINVRFELFRLNSFLTSLRVVSGHILLRANHQRICFYEEEMREWASSNNLAIKIVLETDSNFADSKLQLTSMV